MAESEKARRNRQLIELLNEIRVALPGVQVLFAFLLTVPFADRFTSTTSFQRDVYFTSLVFAAIATVLLVAPSAFHRIRFQQGDKGYLLPLANRLVIGGLVALSISMSAALLLVSDFIFSTLTAWIVAALGGLLMVGLWFAYPLARRIDDELDDGAEAQPQR